MTKHSSERPSSFLVARAVRTPEQIRAEIEQTFGFFPPFFEPALPTPQVLENLWQQTLFAYIGNPLSALFKEKLNALLSRYCSAPYCMVVHSAALRPLGMTARQVLALLETPTQDYETDLLLGRLPVPPSEEAAAPASDSVLERTLLYCATSVFLEQASGEACQRELRRLLGPELYSHLAIYLAYIKTCHRWIEAHPEISYEADQRAQDNLGPLLAEEPALADFFRTYQERVAGVLQGRVTQEAVAAERVRSTEAIRQSEEKLRLLVDGAKDYAMILLDTEGRVTSWNVGAERILGWTEEEVFGQPADLIFTPEDRAAGMPAQEMTRAAAEGKALDVRWHLRKGGSRFFADGIMESLRGEDGLLRGFAKVLRDATDQTKRAERERFLADLAERARALADPEEVIADALRSVGEFLGASRCVFVDIDIAADTCTTQPDYRADATMASMTGVSPISAFGAVVVAEYGAGHAVVVDDVHLDRAQVPEESIPAYDALGIRAHIGVPVVHSTRLVSCIGVHSAAPRRWTPEEVDLVQSVVERTWLTVEVLRQERARAEERREAQARTAGILESISDAFFALDAEWRFTYVNEQAERVIFQKSDDVLGRVIWDVFPALVDSQFDRAYRRALTEGVVATCEEYFPPLDSWYDVRVYPSSNGVSVFFQNVSERKALEAERERLAERERNIAAQLQDALTPAIPKRIPGMALAKHYEAALAEAGVGGDFYDVFPIDKGCTAIILGDLAGKGLAAATQVATVRNMLRYALYRGRTLAGALDGLNTLLAEQELLTGFCTLFAGAYDSGAGTLKFVNAGQEPALIRRAAGGLIEQLAPTGPVLGGFEEASFEERTVSLLPGDVVAIFSDGLTEVGLSRREMLGVEGVSTLLAEASTLAGAGSAESVAEHLALRLIAGVDAAAQGGVMRDDVCLLVAVAE